MGVVVVVVAAVFVKFGSLCVCDLFALVKLG